ncbi:hypothetical protein R5R35_009718 [Gryllus longicercus]|uniref:Chitin-binding type-2 domain-containing protein n=1 Tax=Gryllus longicercus TaxID=2509291 RepID=A0AAN9W1E6_9ORTH
MASCSSTCAAPALALLLAAALLAPGGGQQRRPAAAGFGGGGGGARGVGGGGGAGGRACPERNGRFPMGGQCDAYLECEDGEATEKLCPDGLLFNAAARHYAYPCQYPVDVDCEGRSSLQPAQPTEDCPHQYGYFREGRDAGDCGRFVTCVDGRGFHLQCPEGLAFSEDTLRCDWPDQVDSCDAEAFLGFRCPDDGSAAADGYRFYRSPSDCQKYFLCVSGRPRLYSCAEDEAFNEDIGVCDGVENVTACARQLSGGGAKVLGGPTQPPRRRF